MAMYLSKLSIYLAWRVGKCSSGVLPALWVTKVIINDVIK